MKVHEPSTVKAKSEFNTDVFYDGQISSKLWLCEKLEQILNEKTHLPLKVWMYGSWQGLLPFMLLVRQKLQFQSLDLFDLDSQAQIQARQVLDHWHFQGQIQIRHHVQDCNLIRQTEAAPDLVINTSCEHMQDLTWWQNLPKGTLFCLQSTDMPHPTHVNPALNLESWKASLGLKGPLLYEGSKFTKYATFSFNRWMLIGLR